MTDQAPATGVGWLRRSFLLSFVVGALSLCVVFTTPSTASADGGLSAVGTALAIGESLGAPGEAVGTATAGGACVASVVCAGVVTGVVVGSFLYATQDHWMPVVKGAFGGALNLFDNSGKSGCAITTTGSLGSASGSNYLGGTYTKTGCSLSYSTMYLNISNSACQNSDGTFTNSVNSVTYNLGSVPQGSATRSFNVQICAAGATVQYVRFRATLTGTYGTSPWQVLGNQVPDSSVSQTSTVECQKPDGTTGTVTKSQVGYPDRVIMPSCEAAFPGGSWPKSFTASGGWPGAEQPIVTYTTPTGVDSPTTKYPDCFSSSGAYLNTCRVRVWINGQPCTIGVAVCTNWQTYEQDNPGADVRCQWGPYTVQLSNCDQLANSYRPDAKTQVLTTANPTTGTPTDPAALPYADPLTGTCWLMCIKPAPPVDPPLDPNLQTDTQTCMAGAVSWNPVDWVFVPVKCALRWAFVPRNAPTFTDLQNPIPSGWVPALPSVPDKPCGTIGFPKLDLGYKDLTYGPTTIVDTCDPPWPDVRAFTYYGTLALVLVPLGFKAFNMVLSALGVYLGIETQIETFGPLELGGGMERARNIFYPGGD